MSGMVAFHSDAESMPKIAPRVRAHFRNCTSSASNHFKSNVDSHLREVGYEDDAQLGSCSRDPIGFEGSMWNEYELARSMPITSLDPSGLACFVCTIIDTVTWLFDSKGKTVGCDLKYKLDLDPKFAPHVRNGKTCPANCQPVATCDDVDLTNFAILKIVEPKKGKCPLVKDIEPQQHCLGINANKCKGDFEQELQDCKTACKNGEYVRHVCRVVKVPGLRQACEAFVNASVDNCIFYCENSRLQQVEDKKK